MSLDVKQRASLLAAHAIEDMRAGFLEEGPVWSGLPTWKCRLCDFSTTSTIDYALAHVGKRHAELFPEPSERRTVTSTLVDPNGRPFLLEV